jgi:hypothetical protein
MFVVLLPSRKKTLWKGFFYRTEESGHILLTESGKRAITCLVAALSLARSLSSLTCYVLLYV